MTFCIEGQLFCKSSFVIGERDQFFDMCYSVFFAPRILI